MEEESRSSRVEPLHHVRVVESAERMAVHVTDAMVCLQVIAAHVADASDYLKDASQVACQIISPDITDSELEEAFEKAPVLGNQLQESVTQGLIACGNLSEFLRKVIVSIPSLSSSLAHVKPFNDGKRKCQYVGGGGEASQASPKKPKDDPAVVTPQEVLSVHSRTTPFPGNGGYYKEPPKMGPCDCGKDLGEQTPCGHMFLCISCMKNIVERDQENLHCPACGFLVHNQSYVESM